MAGPLTARTETAEQRFRLYRQMVRHNRFIALCRLAVPALGVLVLAGLLVQIAFYGSADFSIGRVTVDRDTVTVETPRYSGIAEDGSTFTVQAMSARARLDAVGTIDLTDASLVLLRPNDVELRASATAAELQTALEQVTVPGVTQISNSEGIKGTLTGGFLDARASTLTASGAVHIDFPDGMVLRAEALTYDAHAAIWTFSRATLIVPMSSQAAGPDQ